jgi:regulator of RNase E activity RraB
MVYFILGMVCDRFIFPVFDMLVELIQVKAQVYANKQAQLLQQTEEEPVSTNAIGFHFEPSEEEFFDDDDIEEDKRSK